MINKGRLCSEYCNHYDGVPMVEGTAPCNLLHRMVLWNDYCSLYETDKISKLEEKNMNEQDVVKNNSTEESEWIAKMELAGWSLKCASTAKQLGFDLDDLLKCVRLAWHIDGKTDTPWSKLGSTHDH